MRIPRVHRAWADGRVRVLTALALVAAVALSIVLPSGPVQALGAQRDDDPPGPAPAHQPRLVEHGEVLDDGRPADRQPGGERRRGPLPPLGQHAEHPPAGGIGQGREDGRLGVGHDAHRPAATPCA